MRQTARKVLGLGWALALGACADEVTDDGGQANNGGNNAAVNNSAVNNGDNNGTVNNSDPNNSDPNNSTNNSGVNNGGENSVVLPDVNSTHPRPDEDTTPDPSCPAAWVVFMEGFVYDDDGQGVAGAKAQVCVRNPADRLLCLTPSDTESDGFFRVLLPPNARCVSEATLRSLKPGADSSTTYCHAAAPQGQPVITLSEPLVLFDTERAVELPPAGDGGAQREVVFADGLALDVIPDNFFGGGDGYDGLAVRKLSPGGLCFLEGQPTPEAVYAFSPEGDIDGEGFPVRIPNEANKAPGSQVQLYVLGGLGCTLTDGTILEEASWHNFGTATVSADGTTIESDEGSSLPCLTWFGYR
jgi:hypothetical protein